MARASPGAGGADDASARGVVPLEAAWAALFSPIERRVLSLGDFCDDIRRWRAERRGGSGEAGSGDAVGIEEALAYLRENQ